MNNISKILISIAAIIALSSTSMAFYAPEGWELSPDGISVCVGAHCALIPPTPPAYKNIEPVYTLLNQIPAAQPSVRVPYRSAGFTGYGFGLNACDRVRILTQLESTPHTRYTLENIYWGEYKYTSLDGMINMCTRLGADMDKPIDEGFYQWTPN